ncbi:hypothetical protein Ahy_B07g086980 [Arachis hypogaea]|uniref:Uncharacterized protein n=1 Tax=Arachis hypogaea TaxID=3818 RepID=A0A444YAY8_ARAHY|nr:hypothetical protein Ahy_B07g086980 [Arachis hypogaea]
MKKNGLTSYRLVENDSHLVHGLLEVKGALVGSSRREKGCSQFDNDRVTLLLRSKTRNPLNMIQKGSYFIVDQRFLYEKYESEFEEGEGFGLLEYGALGTFYLIVSKDPVNWNFPIGLGHFGASGSFMRKRMSFKRMIWSSCRPIHLGPCRSTLFPIEDQPFVSVSVFSHRQFFADEEMSKGLLTF